MEGGSLSAQELLRGARVVQALRILGESGRGCYAGDDDQIHEDAAAAVAPRSDGYKSGAACAMDASEDSE